MTIVVSNQEFVRRINWLAGKFPTYRLQFSAHYQNEAEVHQLLKDNCIDFKVHHGSYYHSFAEDIYDTCVILNISAERELTVDYRLTSFNDKHYCDSFYNNNDKYNVIQIIFRRFNGKPDLDNYDIVDVRQLVDDVISNVFAFCS